MKDGSIINGFNNLAKLIQMVDNKTKIALAGEMLMQQALKDILIEKGLFTEKELASALTKVIEKANKAAVDVNEAQEKKLIKPTAQQAAKIDASKTSELPEAPKKE